MSMCKFQVKRVFTWEDILENNINYILKHYLITQVLELRCFFDRKKKLKREKEEGLTCVG